MNIFIDTNVFLSFYHFSKEDLGELEKLSVLLRENRAKLFLTQQVADEFRRNRAGKIAHAIQTVSEAKLRPQFPRMFMDYPEYGAALQAIDGAEGAMKALIAAVESDVGGETLKADEVINALFESAQVVEVPDSVVRRAELRAMRGNPPGKKGSLGDAINWEALLGAIPESEDLFFISEDGDFASALNADDFNAFLLDEWSSKRDSAIRYHKRLSAFFREQFPQIKLASELEKEFAIRDFVASGSFAATRDAIAKLHGYDDFTKSQLNTIFRAAGSNNQIHWIIKDDDIEAYFRELLNGREADVEEDVLKRLRFRLGDIPARQFYFGDGIQEEDE